MVPPARRVLITDFDGTLTEKDIYVLIAERFMPLDAPKFFDEFRKGRMTHFEAIRAYLSRAPADEAAWHSLMEDARIEPGFRDDVARLERAGWKVIVASAGSSWYIERMLERAGVSDLEIHANPGQLQPGRGLWIQPPADGRFFSDHSGIDKQAIVKDALSRADEVAFAGDGPPDLSSALLVRPDLRFARGWLAEELARRREPFRAFQRWSEIAVVLSSTNATSDQPG